MYVNSLGDYVYIYLYMVRDALGTGASAALCRSINQKYIHKTETKDKGQRDKEEQSSLHIIINTR